MATLTNPINQQNIVDRFRDYVTVAANSGIVWGTDVLPFPEMPIGHFAGTTAGKTVAIDSANLGTLITLTLLRDVLFTEGTIPYSNIRNLRAIKTFQTGASVGVIYDTTAVANTVYDATVAEPATPDPGLITMTGTEAYFDRLKAAYLDARNSTPIEVTIATCHSNHSNTCHSSRSRR